MQNPLSFDGFIQIAIEDDLGVNLNVKPRA